MSWRLEIHHLDVGQGDSTLILVKNNNDIKKSVLIDGGPKSAEPNVASYLGCYLNNKPLDIIILSHNHADHSDGLEPLINNNKCECQKSLKFAPRKRIINNVVFSECNPKQELLQLSNKSITMTCIHGDIKNKNENLNSLAFLVQFYGFRYYTGGDLEGPGEVTVAKSLNNKLLPVHAFKAGHHGSSSSTRDPFLKTMQPQVAIVSAGGDDGQDPKRYHYRFNHPTLTFLRGLDKHPIERCYLTSCSLKSDGFITEDPLVQQKGRFRVAGYADENQNNFQPGHIMLTIDEQSTPLKEFKVIYNDVTGKKKKRDRNGNLIYDPIVEKVTESHRF